MPSPCPHGIRGPVVCPTRQPMGHHAPVTTLEELDALDEDELVAGYLSAQKGDPEPGANHTRAYHHGWRTRMMDRGEIPVPDEHAKLVRVWVSRGGLRQ
jgi:hypothetical protein